MSERQEQLPALGQPAGEPVPEAEQDFAGEHDSTAVDDRITAGQDRSGESPHGWSGMDHDGPP